LDNGVYHKFVYSSRDGNKEDHASQGDDKKSVNDLRPMSSRNDTERGRKNLKMEIDRRVKEGKRIETEMTEEADFGDETSDNNGIGVNADGSNLDHERVQTLVNFGYNEEYVRLSLMENEASYCLAGYYLLGEDQKY
jgi:hypothetical protein